MGKRGRKPAPRCLSCGAKIQQALPRLGSYCPVCVHDQQHGVGTTALEFVWFGIDFLLVRNARASRRRNTLMEEECDRDDAH